MTLKTITLIDLINQVPYPDDEPFFLDVKLFDLPSVIVGAINNLPENCVGITVDHDIGIEGRAVAVDIARRNNLSINFI